MNPNTASSYGSSFHTRLLRIWFYQHLNVLKPPKRFKITNSLWICVFIPSNFAYRCKAGNPLPCNQSQIFPLGLLWLTLVFTLWHESLLLPCNTASDLSTTHCSTCCEIQSICFVSYAAVPALHQLPHQRNWKVTAAVGWEQAVRTALQSPDLGTRARTALPQSSKSRKIRKELWQLPTTRHWSFSEGTWHSRGCNHSCESYDNSSCNADQYCLVAMSYPRESLQ